MGLFNLLFGNKKNNVDLISLNRDLEIVNECAKLIENTVNPEVFFSRYDLYMEKLAVLAETQASHRIKVKGNNLVQKYEKMKSPEQKIDKMQRIEASDTYREQIY